MATLLLRADASPTVGSGHVMRCLALAQAWATSGGKTTFLCAPGLPSLDARLAAEGCSVVHTGCAPGSAADATATAALASRLGAVGAVLDSYSFGREYVEAVQRAVPVLVLDDDGRLDGAAPAALLNQNSYAKAETYARCPSETVRLLGSPFALLRREFLDLVPKSLGGADAVENVLVTLGGADPENVTARVAQAMLLLPEPVRARLVVGAANPHGPVLQQLAAQNPHRLEVVTAGKDMAQIMAAADLAVLAAGSTVWEACFLGLPFVTVVIAQNQVAGASDLQARGIAPTLGWATQLSSEDIAAAVTQLIVSAKQRREMSKRGRELINGRGAERVVQWLHGRGY